jgi:hypothetical protein
MKIAGSHPLGNAARPITGFAGGKRLALGPKEYLVRPAHHAGKVVTPLGKSCVTICPAAAALEP